MSYLVKEVFATLQGEGVNAGRVAVFCRFSGCNLWTGHEEHRHLAVCRFCDTDFVGTDGPGGGRFADADALADHVAATWPVPPVALEARDEASAEGSTPAGTAEEGSSPGDAGSPMVVCTGGEPLLQLDEELVAAFHARGFEVAIETNGTRPVPDGVDWVCVSPKAGAELVVTSGDELKLVYPQQGGEPERYEGLDFTWFCLQPMDGPDREANSRAAIAACLARPRWRLSLQTHKELGIP